MTSERELDVIIFGATGYTGKCTVFEGVKILKDLKWGVAGRSKEKLEKVLQEIGAKAEEDLSKIPIITADINDAESLKKMAEKCKVVVNCVGPYRFWGEPVVKACIETGTHQVDVTGEPQYMERMVYEYGDKAKEKGSYIVSACGFDSIPADMGVAFLEKRFDGVVNSVESYLQLYGKISGPSVHYGTWASLVHGVAHFSELKDLRKKLFPERLPKFEPVLKTRGTIHKSNVTGKWCLPFLGADKSVIQRSQRYFYEMEKKRPIQVKTYYSTNSFLEMCGLLFFGLMLGIMTRFSCGINLLLNYPQIFSFGLVSKEDLSDEATKSSKFAVHLKGKGWTEKLADPNDSYTNKPDKDIYVKVKGTNVGYGATCVALLLAAKTIIIEKNNLPQVSGVFTPAIAFSKTNLVDELCKNGFTFEVVGATEEAKE